MTTASGKHAFRHEAMATHWECHLLHADPATARQAALEIFALVDEVEAQLSRFRHDSDTALIRRLEPGRFLHVRDATFDCLELGLAVHAESGGAFDLTMTPFYDSGRCPRQAVCGMEHLMLDPETRSVAVRSGPVCLDFGAIGKGHALDQALPLLSEWEIEGWLLVAGDSTMLAGGAGPSPEGWPVGVSLPGGDAYHLRDEALSTSGFQTQGYHIYDPRTRQAVRGSRQKSWVFAPSAALADAVSTAMLVMEDDEIERFCARHPEIGVITG